MSNGDDILEIDVAEDSYELEVEDLEDRYSCAIVIELDDKLNAGRSCFEPGETIWVKIYSPTVYNVYLTGGGATLDNNFLLEQIPDPDDESGDDWEYINFSNWSGSATKPLWEIIEKYWCFHDLGEVAWKQRYTGLFAKEPSGSTDLGYGVLRIKYRSRYDLWKITAPTAGHDIKVIAYSTDSENIDDDGDYTCKSELQVTIREDCDVVATIKDITVKTANCESDEAIAGVSVYIENVFKGVTGVDGTLFVGKFGSGEYDIRFEHPDYWPSGTDGVINDTFVVD